MYSTSLLARAPSPKVLFEPEMHTGYVILPTYAKNPLRKLSVNVLPKPDAT